METNGPDHPKLNPTAQIKSIIKISKKKFFFPPRLPKFVEINPSVRTRVDAFYDFRTLNRTLKFLVKSQKLTQTLLMKFRKLTTQKTMVLVFTFIKNKKSSTNKRDNKIITQRPKLQKWINKR